MLSKLPYLLAGLSLLVATAALGQEAEVPEPEDMDTIQPEGEGADQPADKPKEKADKTQAQEEHTVTPGDNLWDLCSRYLSNPWYWPRVWSYNPEITNPHWIYPGQVVRFFPSGELPSEMDIVASRDIEVPEPVEDDMGEEVPEGLVRVVGQGHVQGRAMTTIRILRSGFVTKEEYEDVGVVRAAREEVEYLSNTDIIYLELKDPGQAKVGEQFSIFRTTREIEHPVTEDVVGFQTQVVGTCEVTNISENLVSAVILKTIDPVVRGDKVAPLMKELSTEVNPKPNGVELRGYILAGEVEQLTMLGENHLVFIDQGSEQGVQEGNVFDVIRREDGLFMPGTGKEENKWDKAMPAEIWGRVMVVDARKTVSTAVVIASLRELRPGDRVLMSVQ
ncbi:MAG TPA: LysM peptidoglycan-binding domain-containing protein [Myxococcota bacterium]|nr:LysM peptidoglycan-binding domain-containing protein [Myxococcota bacterium]HRY94778.1 LysM peptidoglycan-binding domain-containing protein [Myxococcota bacterium]HSA22699.1 LysM peptidoglycan-binding domain-containing protein [Myxococcota bacterium]